MCLWLVASHKPFLVFISAIQNQNQHNHRRQFKYTGNSIQSEDGKQEQVENPLQEMAFTCTEMAFSCRRQLWLPLVFIVHIFKGFLKYFNWK